jgi:hypothetical protein
MSRYLPYFIFITLAVYGAVLGLYATAEMEVPWRLGFIFKIGLFVAVAYWYQNDLRNTKLSGLQDAGFFIVLFWPVLLPIHLWRTRRRKGLLIVFAAVVTLIGVAVTVQFVLSLIFHK